LGVALGRAGSGRQRYAVAMTLYQAGQISAAQLEAYRAAAASDTSSPDPVLEDRGLPPVRSAFGAAPEAVHENAPENRRAILEHLLDEADTYLATLPGPGVSEVREGLARWRGGADAATPGSPNTTLDRHMPQALAELGQTHTSLAEAIRAALPHLKWITYDGYDPALIGAEFMQGHAYASIIGEEASIAAVEYDFGLFLIAPHVLYRDHRHAAPELYAPLTGPHGWRFGPDTPLLIKQPHEPVWNPAHQPHMTKVGPMPFLCFFGWTRDVQPLAQVLPASDWPALEALRLTR
jgi:hypothetical protein